MAISINLLIFTGDFVNSDLYYYFGGYSFIGIFTFNFAVNMVFFLYELLRTLYFVIRYRYYWLQLKIKGCIAKRKQVKNARKRSFKNFSFTESFVNHKVKKTPGFLDETGKSGIGKTTLFIIEEQDPSEEFEPHT